MNLDELKPLWESYKEQVSEPSEWNRTELANLLKTGPPPLPWYKKAQRPLLHFCISCVLISITSGC